MTTKETIFTCKEHYLAFRAAWAKTANQKDNNITGTHHMLYNILRGRAFDKGFTPITRTTKLQNGFRINHGVYLATQDLRYPHYLLNVFDGTVTKEMLDNILMPEVKSMDSDYGPYKKVAQHIIESNTECKPHSFNDIQMILEYVIKEHKCGEGIGKSRKKQDWKRHASLGKKPSTKDSLISAIKKLLMRKLST